MRATLPLLLVMLAATASGQPANPYNEPTPNTTVWPVCVPGQIEVMLLGTVHMANPGLDANNIDVPDVRTPEIQAELDALTDLLATYGPQKVMVERLYGSEQDNLDSAYAAYLASGGQTESRNETQQVGFRLARRLGHDAVYPIDYRLDMAMGQVEQYAQSGGPVKHTMDYNNLIPERFQIDYNQVIRDLDMTAYHIWLNDDVALRANHLFMFGQALGAGNGEAYPGPDLLASWYSRNLNMVHHILRWVEPGDERLLVLVGSGHVRAMRHFLDEAPRFCPVSPLPTLQASAQP